MCKVFVIDTFFVMKMLPVIKILPVGRSFVYGCYRHEILNGTGTYTLCPEKVVHQTHCNNLVLNGFSKFSHCRKEN